MFGRKRQTIGFSNTPVIAINNTYEAAATAIGFNFESVGNSVGGKTVAVKLHKIRYTPFMQGAPGVLQDLRSAEINILKGLSLIDSEFSLGVEPYELYQDFFDTQAAFGVDVDFFSAWGNAAGTSVDTLNVPIHNATKEVELDILLPLTNINSICYFSMFFGATPAVGNWAFGHGAELTWSYELLSPQDFQTLKFDWQTRSNFQTPVGKLILQ